MKQYKDACDECGKFDYCKGHESKVYCPECLKKQEETNNGKTNSSSETTRG